MSRWDWLKVIVLILLPINTWIIVLLYPKWQWGKMWWEGERRSNEIRSITLEYIRKTRFRIQEEKVLPYPFPFHVQVLGQHPPIGKGVPVLLIHMTWIGDPEVWDLAIFEAMKSNLNLHIALLYQSTDPPITRKVIELWRKQIKGRLSMLLSPNWYKVFGDMYSGTLAVLCDGSGIVRHMEPYPKLKISPFWHEEVADWRPKFQQAVKRVLDKAFSKPSE